MKLSTVFAKLTCRQSTVGRSLAALAFAGVISLASAPQAQAQHVAFGVQIGGPAYIAPAYTGPAYGYSYAGPRYSDWRARQEWREREEWQRRQEWQRLHAQPYGFHVQNYGYGDRGRDFDDHRRFDDRDDHHGRGW